MYLYDYLYVTCLQLLNRANIRLQFYKNFHKYIKMLMFYTDPKAYSI